MGERTKQGGASLRAMPAGNSNLRRLQSRLATLELTPRLLVGLFCAGMILGVLVKGWVPGATYGEGGFHENLSQLNSAFFAGPAADNRGRDDFGLRPDGGRWMMHFSEDGRVLDVRTEK